jgi:hypothetical protein
MSKEPRRASSTKAARIEQCFRSERSSGGERASTGWRARSVSARSASANADECIWRHAAEGRGDEAPVLPPCLSRLAARRALLPAATLKPDGLDHDTAAHMAAYPCLTNEMHSTGCVSVFDATHREAFIAMCKIAVSPNLRAEDARRSTLLGGAEELV